MDWEMKAVKIALVLVSMVLAVKSATPKPSMAATPSNIEASAFTCGHLLYCPKITLISCMLSCPLAGGLLAFWLRLIGDNSNHRTYSQYEEVGVIYGGETEGAEKSPIVSSQGFATFDGHSPLAMRTIKYH